MGLFVIEKNGKKIVGGKNKFVVDYEDLPEEIKQEDLEREKELEAQQQEEQKELIKEKPVIYEKPKRGLFKKKEKKVKVEKKEETPEPKKEAKIVDSTSNINNYVSNDRNYLNNITYANNEVEEKIEHSSLYKGKLKTESTIFCICFKSVLMSYLIYSHYSYLKDKICILLRNLTIII